MKLNVKVEINLMYKKILLFTSLNFISFIHTLLPEEQCGNNGLQNLVTGLTNDRFSSNVTYPFMCLVCPSGLCQKDSSFLKRIKRFPILDSAIRRYPFHGMNGLQNSSAVGDISSICCMSTCCLYFIVRYPDTSNKS